MAFIRRRKSTLSWSYQVIETYREGGKVHQRVLANLGECSSIDERLTAIRKRCGAQERSLVDAIRRAENAIDRGEEARLWFEPGRWPDIPRRRARIERLKNEITALEQLAQHTRVTTRISDTPHPAEIISPSAQRLIREFVDGLNALCRRNP
jgi:hypothetical protein